MSNEEKILSLLVEMNGRLGTVEKDVSGIKQEVSDIKQQLNKAEQDNTKAFEMLAGHMIDNTTRLERIEAVQKENTEKLNDIPTIKQMVLNHEFNFQKMRIS